MQRQKFTAELKAKVALDTIRNDLTIPEISKKYNVHPTQIQRWKAELLANAQNMFGKEKSETSQVDEKKLAVLERKVGQLTMENDFLKKNLENYHKGNASKW